MKANEFDYGWKFHSSTKNVRALVLRYTHPISKKRVETSLKFLKIDITDFNTREKTYNGGCVKTNELFKNVKQSITDYVIDLKSFDDFDDELLKLKIYDVENSDVVAIKEENLYDLIKKKFEEIESTLNVGEYEKTNAVVKHFKNYSKAYKTKLKIKSIDMNFMPNFEQYLISLKLRKARMCDLRIRLIRLMKLVLSDSKFTSYLNFVKNYSSPLRNFKDTKTDKVWIKKDEADAIYAMDFSDYIPKNNDERKLLRKVNLRDIQDWIYIGVHLGQRLQTLKTFDSSQIDEENGVIRDVYLPKVDDVIPYLRLDIMNFDYFNTHSDFPPIPRYDNDMNCAIRLICREYGNDMLSKIKGVLLQKVEGFKGNRGVVGIYYKWQLVSSHTLRRSLITNLKVLGVGDKQIMCISGHKDINTLRLYDVSNFEENSILLNQNIDEINKKMKLEGLSKTRKTKLKHLNFIKKAS